MAFTGWIAAAVAVAMAFPGAFQHWGPLDLRNRWAVLILVQSVMFGMGTQMSVADFAGVFRMPRAVLVGIACHFTVMPLVGWSLARAFALPPEIAAGVILIGSCSSGLASNVMAYIARSNLALSVTVTAVTTLLAPVMTPLWMRVLAGAYVRVDFGAMMQEIVKIVLVPIGAALIHDVLKRAPEGAGRGVRAVGLVGAAWLIAIALGGWNWLSQRLGAVGLDVAALAGFCAAAVLVGLAYHLGARRWSGLEKLMPRVSMAGIIYFTLVTTAAGRDNLLKVGGALFAVAALHNAAGYAFGYALARVAGLDRQSARSISFEVGLQNGSMASGLAAMMGKLGTVGLAPAVFSPWMNISGSLLANAWRRRPPS